MFSDSFKGNNWDTSNYVGLHCPFSPSISLQWTLRDGHLVNLPSPLLVRGDVILLRPGQLAPARCRSLPVLHSVWLLGVHTAIDLTGC